MRVAITGVWLLLTALLACQCGCAVPQQPGKGMARHRTEPETRTGYWLYLPEDYVKRSGRHPSRQRWPTVVTFHGMNPYDTAAAQIREWQEEADRYGLIVIAPELRTCTSLMQYPLRDPNLWYVKQDERATLLVMGEVFRQTNADPNLVLATSFSSGGYLAHFLVNRYPERFSCLAVRGSNFSSDLVPSIGTCRSASSLARTTSSRAGMKASWRWSGIGATASPSRPSKSAAWDMSATPRSRQRCSPESQV